MIVTRQRRKPFPWRRLILPLVAIALVTFALVWQPSRNVIANGPLAPAWRSTAPALSALAEPFHYAAQNEIITQRNGEIVKLQRQVADLQKQLDAKTKTVATLNGEVQQLQLQSAQRPAPSRPPVTAGANPAAAAGGGTAPSAAANDLAAGATPDMRRVAQYWASMEPENAAKVVQRQPIPYAARILALMSPDAVGAILDALPAAYAAKLTQDHPELKK